jgi:RNA polymerase sigma-70 factor, ECF subfamily
MAPPMNADGLTNAEAERAITAQLLQRTGAGDRTAFSALYSRTSAKLFGIALRILNDQENAEDALQEIYVAVWNNAARFDASRASPMTWLMTLARNRAIDRQRRLRVSGTFAPVELADMVADAAPLADQAMMQDEETAALHSCLGGLDQNDAGFIQSAFLRGASYSELADGAAMPLGTVKSRIRRALLKLRVCLDGRAREANNG